MPDQRLSAAEEKSHKEMSGSEKRRRLTKRKKVEIGDEQRQNERREKKERID